MKVLMINGSPKAAGNTARALAEMTGIFEQYGVEIEYLHVGNKEIRGCVGCGTCYKAGKCFMDDIVNEAAQKLAECDGVVIGSPVYYAAANGTLVAFLDRLFYSTTKTIDRRMKVGASVAVARRGGCSATFDQLNKYFTIAGMPVASSQYWNSVHGAKPGEVESDEEGLQTMRTLAHNMVFLMRSIELGKEKYGLPEKEAPARTNFIR
ncbi:MAG: flavodoxin family protein [Ruminococcaceae bacterium]|nr:flavodoxin family protein [Oscillospiraceae bacterium]